jgi:hypothetical protein
MANFQVHLVYLSSFQIQFFYIDKFFQHQPVPFQWIQKFQQKSLNILLLIVYKIKLVLLDIKKIKLNYLT